MSIADVILNSAKRYLYPKLMTVADDLVNVSSAIGKSASASLDYNPALESMHTWLTRTAKDDIAIARQAARSIHSPSMVLGRTEAGRKIINAGTTTQLEWNKFVHPRMEGIDKASRGIKSEYASAYDAVADPTLIPTLSEKAKKMRDFAKTDYDFLWNRYALLESGNDVEGFNAAVNLIKKVEVSPEEIKALSPGGQKAYGILIEKVDNYATRLWDREEALANITKQRDKFASKLSANTNPSRQKFYAEKVAEYQKSLDTLSGGTDPLTYKNLPGEYFFKYQVKRKPNAPGGYVHDLPRAYRSYVYSMAKKTIDEPGIKEMVKAYKELPFEDKAYARNYIREFAGLGERNWFDKMAGEIASFEYVRTLGFFNLRSPLVNLTQQLNTFLDAGPTASIKGYIRALSKESTGEKAWLGTGLQYEAPHTLTEDISPNAGVMERLKRVTGVLFNLAENANRKHAFLTYLTKYEEKLGVGNPEAVKKAIAGVHNSQFQYGRVDMPMILRRGPGRLIGQFTSFPIKQIEFYQRLWKKDPKRVIVAAGIMWGGNKAVGDVLGIDLSNSLGFGISFGEALNMFTSASKGDLDEAVAHGKMVFAQGSGILPSGPGPAVSGLMKLGASIGKGTFGETLKTELLPINYQRVEQLIDSIKNRSMATEEGKVPIFGPSGEMKFEQGLVRTISELGPKSKERTKKQLEWYKQSTFDQLESKRKRIIAETIAIGNNDKAERLIEKWGIVPTRDAIYEAMQRRNLPREARKKWQQAELRQLAREEQDLTEEE